MAVELWLVWERFVAVRQVMDWRGSQGFAGHVTVERGEAGQSTVGQGSRGLARRGEVQYVAANRGMAGHGSQVGASPVTVRYRRGMARRGRQGKARIEVVR